MFKHDCDSCQPLGEYGYPRHESPNTLFDLYYCPRCDEGSFIARYGNEGSEYESAPLNIVLIYDNPTNPLVEALKRQIKKWQHRDEALVALDEYLSALQRQLRDGYNDTASGLIATSRNTLKGMK